MHLCFTTGTGSLPMGFSQWKRFPYSISRTLYLSIGSSCCSWLSRIVWYSLSYFFSFFVGTCETHLENMHLKIKDTPERLSESSSCKQEAKEVLESCCQIKSLPVAPLSLLSNTIHIDRNLSVPSTINYSSIQRKTSERETFNKTNKKKKNCEQQEWENREKENMLS